MIVPVIQYVENIVGKETMVVTGVFSFSNNLFKNNLYTGREILEYAGTALNQIEKVCVQVYSLIY